MGDRTIANPHDLIGMPGTDIGDPSNDDVPLGTGLLVMTALGAGYAINKRRARR